jgi:hypothetical protein
LVVGLSAGESAHFSVRTKTHTLSVHIENWKRPKDVNKPFDYRISLWDRESKKAVFSLLGRGKYDGEQFLTENWQQEEFVVVLIDP